MSQFYTDPKRETDEHALPDVEVFYIDAGDPDFNSDDDGEPCEAGYYYWFCFPGCLPDSEPFGPFDSEQAAMDDARENVADFDDED